MGLYPKALEEETHESDQGDSEFADLFDNALCCAKAPCRDDPVVSPPGTKGTADPLQKVEYKKRELLGENIH